MLGSGTLGLLATLVLRLRGLEVTTFGNTMPPYLNSKLIEELGARYVSTKELSLTDASAKYGAFDYALLWPNCRTVDGHPFSPVAILKS